YADRERAASEIDSVSISDLSWPDKLEALTECSMEESDALNEVINGGDPREMKLALESLIESYHNELLIEQFLNDTDYID
ncbi:MAG: hypothetical protein OEM38_09325, partial [Gammaproteobacteria bacterium]|nr:hypothetical protein [Gammaproteobacteria bacterium]